MIKLVWADLRGKRGTRILRILRICADQFKAVVSRSDNLIFFTQISSHPSNLSLSSNPRSSASIRFICVQNCSHTTFIFEHRRPPSPPEPFLFNRRVFLIHPFSLLLQPPAPRPLFQLAPLRYDILTKSHSFRFCLHCNDFPRDMDLLQSRITREFLFHLFLSYFIQVVT